MARFSIASIFGSAVLASSLLAAPLALAQTRVGNGTVTGVGTEVNSHNSAMNKHDASAYRHKPSVHNPSMTNGAVTGKIGPTGSANIDSNPAGSLAAGPAGGTMGSATTR